MSNRLDLGFLQASAVCFNGAGVLLLGASGSGKSSTALGCIALGAKLVGDDGVILSSGNGSIVLEGIESTKGLIEARGVGILHADYVAQTTLCLIVELDQQANARLPDIAPIQIAERAYRTIHAKGIDNLAIILRQIVTNELCCLRIPLTNNA